MEVCAVAEERDAMIRQAISCDICGMEMQRTHRCFVAFDKGTELRVSGWITRRRMGGGALHLCGQKCLHKLVDQFISRTLAVGSNADQQSPEEAQCGRRYQRVDGSLTSLPADLVARRTAGAVRPFEEAIESRARLVAPLEPGARTSIEMGTDRGGMCARAWGSAAWQRERERQRVENAAGQGTGRRSIA